MVKKICNNQNTLVPLPYKLNNFTFKYKSDDSKIK